ncbi:MAG: hypothetical protein FJ295_00335 [Planctomycetes bacterium]|nr:hypothetical protein [Planctomycetota bacterium]
MWCSTCQQDVPAIVLPGSDDPQRCCARCKRRFELTTGGDLAEKNAASGGAVTEARGVPRPASGSEDHRLLFDTWKLDEELRAADDLLRRIGLPARPLENPLTADVEQRRAELAMRRVNAAHAPTQTPARRTQTPEAEHDAPDRYPARRTSWIAWLALGFGITTLVCGGVLIGWSLVAPRPDLWNIGLPLALIGQAAVVIGLLLQLDRLWQSSRATSEAIQQIDGEIEHLRHSTRQIAAHRSPSAQSFYAHWADGAGPHLLLTDLKGQLDLLSEQLADRERRQL